MKHFLVVFKSYANYIVQGNLIQLEAAHFLHFDRTKGHMNMIDGFLISV